MSYCVNCGVKLAPSEGKCPLCQTVTQNPIEPYDPRAPKPYPQRTEEQNISIDKKYYTMLLALVLLVPAAICLLVDLVGDLRVYWSLYPMGALMMAFVIAAAPMLAGRHRTYTAIVADSAVLCLFLWLIETLSESGEWFTKIAFPLILLGTIMTLALVASIKQKLFKGLLVPAVGLVLIAILTIAAELLISSTVAHTLTLSWSLYVMITCFLMALAMFLLHLNQPLRSELHRRLHI